MAEWSKALRSGRSPLLWAWVRIPLLTKPFCFWCISMESRVAQWKRAGPITQRSVDRNYALLTIFIPATFMETKIIGGLVRDLNPGPLAPKARIIPLDQQATHTLLALDFRLYIFLFRVLASITRLLQDKRQQLLTTCKSAQPSLSFSFVLIHCTLFPN